jgi:RNA polymerase sigma-70 factor, ECF subfamily
MKNRGFSNTQEKKWIELAQNNDLDAFNQLVLSYQDTAFSFASWMLDGDPYAEDIVQTAFLTAYRNIKHLRGSSFRAWLLKIIRNLCIDELRRRYRHPSMPLEPMNDKDQTFEDADWLIAPGLSPEELVIEHEKWKEVEQSIQQLPDHLRDVLILIDIETLDYQEAATILNVPCGTIKSRISRARACLRALLSRGFSSAAITGGSTFEYIGVSESVRYETVHF